jgi:uncharacterized protein YjbI with pentapeptide repeats
MCKHKSGWYLETGELIHAPETDDHESLAQAFGLRDNHITRNRMVRVELQPPDDPKEIQNPEAWKLVLDEENAPSWWEDAKENCKAKLWIEVQKEFLIGEKNCVIGGTWILLPETRLKKLVLGRIVWGVSANLGGANLSSAVLRDANLSGADLRGADLGGADLRGADLGGAYLEGADLRCAYLEGADLRDADLRCANLGGANLGGADLGGADLRGAYFGGASLSGADLGGADLRGANLRGANLRDAYRSSSDAKIEGWKVVDWKMVKENEEEK